MAGSDLAALPDGALDDVATRVGTQLEGGHSGTGLRFGIACARFNGGISLRLLTSALDRLAEAGADRRDLTVAWARVRSSSPWSPTRSRVGKVDAVLCFGAVIRGETGHYEFVAGECAAGIAARATVDRGPGGLRRPYHRDARTGPRALRARRHQQGPRGGARRHRDGATAAERAALVAPSPPGDHDARGCSVQDQLGAAIRSHRPFGGHVGHGGVPHLCRASGVQRRSRGDDLVPLLGARDEVGGAVDRGEARRALGQWWLTPNARERVGEREHDRGPQVAGPSDQRVGDGEPGDGILARRHVGDLDAEEVQEVVDVVGGWHRPSMPDGRSRRDRARPSSAGLRRSTPMLRLVLPKGSLERATLQLFEDADLAVTRASDVAYRATIADPRISEVRILRPQEIPVYVADGLFDLGITGRDCIEERGSEVVSLGELAYSKATSNPARVVLAVGADSAVSSLAELATAVADRPGRLRVSTEYPELTRRALAEHGIDADIAMSYGATEAKVPDIADAVVDMTETGSALRAAGLKVIETLLVSHTELIANPAAAADPEKRHAMEQILTLLQGTLEAGARCSSSSTCRPRTSMPS